MSPLFMILNHSEEVIGADSILAKDPHGFTLAVISISVVLMALLVLAVLIFLFSKVIALSTKKSCASVDVAECECESVGDNAEVIAAIAFALKLYKADLHDKESEVITLNSVARAYSPWSSKIHGLTRMPR